MVGIILVSGFLMGGSMHLLRISMGTACEHRTRFVFRSKRIDKGCRFGSYPFSNEIIIEWEYDATLQSSINLEVPAKKLFSLNDLWWNGCDGFSNANGKTMFFDPQLSSGGSHALLADYDDLQWRLKKIGYRLIWTLLGEKRILNADHDSPQICYSQLAWLAEDGSVK